ncbi:RING finger protein 208 [Chanos chanos]|uniref:RING finger protein 208 n=1 Tax=Chanos chanos TaxID=29144 RepID=A0A6J2WMX8_CHACN|nr:RING finger protein 208-like [Chanos chanos]
MVLSEDLECTVCYAPYSRSERIPRVLFCRHTFCAPCLEAMALEVSSYKTVRCPLCRQMTCLNRGVAIQEGLWVNSQVWDNIPETEEKDEIEEERTSARTQIRRPKLTLCSTSKNNRPKLRLPSFLRKLTSTRHPQERIVPGCNVEMRSWRRLSVEETF